MSGDFDVEAEMEAMAAEEAAAAVQEEPEEEEVIGPLVISDAHSCFSLDKITEADDTLGEYNPRHLHCEFCGIIILLEGSCCKVKKEVNLLNNTQREYDLHSTYWHVDDMRKFSNVEIHQREGDLKYLCCFSC